MMPINHLPQSIGLYNWLASPINKNSKSSKELNYEWLYTVAIIYTAPDFWIIEYH